ncbi:flagellar hook-length control protein FliK [Cohnella endophytica]|uniref:Flagellar hook-length control protein FliK n=1 Tax=Cohnella endophytica TaxID=2419778 RepID=A0A494Y6A7_9BACL|nr:flagellar hook-length control protein FliK [Cohnella endophytica]RKP55460.1 flagellar hook-length control protein FliK [Cohnella endophytica]
MNMTISSNSTPIGKTVSANASSASSAVSGSGFAGALVQAIDGKSAPTPTNGGLSLPIALTGLLGQLGEDATAEPAQDLLEMLTKLIEQLQQLEKDGSDSLTSDTQDQLASLLAAFQSVLQQTNPIAIKPETEAGQAVGAIAETDTPEVKPSVASNVISALRETLQQLSKAVASGKEGASAAANFTAKLQAVLDANAGMPSASTQPVQVTKADESQASVTPKDVKDAGNGKAVPKETFGQAAVVVQEQRRPIQALRDPIWRFNVEGTEDTRTENKANAVVPAVATAKEANQSESQPVWTYLANDSVSKADSSAMKATLPAQVPVQQFAEQVEKFLVKQFQLTLGNGTSEAKLSLTPEHLGQVDIRIVMHNGQLTAQFMTDNAMAKDMLENQMAQLKTSLSGQGLQVERLEVVQQSSSASTSFMQQEQRHSSSGNGQGGNGRGKGEALEDSALFAAEMERTSSLKDFGFGGSISTTA